MTTTTVVSIDDVFNNTIPSDYPQLQAMLGSCAPLFLAKRFGGKVIGNACHNVNTGTTYATGVGKFPYCFIRSRSRNKSANLDLKRGHKFAHFVIVDSKVTITFYTKDEVVSSIKKIMSKSTKSIPRYEPKTQYVQSLVQIRDMLLSFDESKVIDAISDLCNCNITKLKSWLTMINIHQHKTELEIINSIFMESQNAKHIQHD